MKIGDKITIACRYTGSYGPCHSNPGWNDKMDKWLGREMTVSKIREYGKLEVEENEWTWSELWISNTVSSVVQEELLL